MRAREIELGIGDELVVTSRRTKIVLGPRMLRDMLCSVDRYAHAADGIDGGAFEQACVRAHRSSFLTLQQTSYSLVPNTFELPSRYQIPVAPHLIGRHQVCQAPPNRLTAS